MNERSDDLSVEIADADRPGVPSAPVVIARSEAVRAIETHGRQDLERELGGVLVGTAASGPEGTVVFVEAAIPAAHTQAGRASVTFTHETWQQIHQAKDREYPDKRIVGWYHTHPGFGLFLSEYDQFIHRNFFNLPWQVAWVMDPRAGTSGVFVWQNGELTGPHPCEVTGTLQPALPVPVAAAANGEVAVWGRRLLLGLVVVVALELAQLLVPRPGPQEQATLLTATSGLERELAELRRVVTELKAAPEPLQKPRPSEATSAEPSPMRRITVRRGDNLWQIARREYGNGALWGAIAVANGITRDELEPGMVLVIPQPPRHGEARGERE